jgi:hypothetical protein
MLKQKLNEVLISLDGSKTEQEMFYELLCGFFESTFLSIGSGFRQVDMKNH